MGRNFYDWNASTRVLFGPGRLNDLGDQPMPGKKAMVVISSGKSTRANGYLDRTQAELARAGVESCVFDGVGPNPLKSAVEAGAKAICDNGCDFVVALGGGSVLDAGKAMAMFATQPNTDLWDFAGGITGKRMKPSKPSLPWIAITTTAGTGSEVDHHGVISNPDTNEKIGVGAPDLYARLAIVDPELMLTVPPRFTAYQGFDALFHSVEGYVSTLHNPMSDMVDRAAIEHVGASLVRAYEDGSDLDARCGMAYANTMGGYSMELTSCVSQHAIEHALSAFHHDLPHGAGLLLITRAWSTFQAKHTPEPERFVDMARFLGKADAADPMDYVARLDELMHACDVADLKMSDWGITKDEFGPMTENALAAYPDRFAIDPAPMTKEDVVAVLEESFS
ncbi:MAG: iron-containing alcohol dehydrogenase [Atopobiaceae bacterium]|jgi:alcohol dehydrogenase|nr:iron-containing alcohol dehydrogenase [Atopobiaceae bacterium]MCI1318313.1 iron-containing alcohol dehydrogenase [Atopobiaceae bacterium]MCI1388232.1 iron-containing alcohol dehydrogenase [Atopobiaceae bacterium]MCI1431518.1 iron-containing alcohol dehydrogenase [Atopobiaceae bacterium]MCI1469954.1 iron-containing alcohol dehydrogenase [Atopobiaceae bacterium]